MVGTTILRAPTHSAYPLIYRGQWGLRNLKKGDVGAFNKNRDEVGKTGGFNKNGQKPVLSVKLIMRLFKTRTLKILSELGHFSWMVTIASQ